jgi:hypothetical protein
VNLEAAPRASYTTAMRSLVVLAVAAVAEAFMPVCPTAVSSRAPAPGARAPPPQAPRLPSRGPARRSAYCGAV